MGSQDTLFVVGIIVLLGVGLFFFLPNVINYNYAALEGLPTFFPTNWGNVTEKPSSFSPSIHSHDLARINITDFWSTPFWSNIPDKPSTFSPSTHNHSANDIISDVLNIARIPTLSSSYIADWGNYINQAVLTSSSPYFSKLGVGITPSDTINIYKVGTTGQPTVEIRGYDINLMLWKTDNGRDAVLGFKDASGALILDLRSSGGSSRLWDLQNHDFIFGTNNGERLRLSAGGGVSITGLLHADSGIVTQYMSGDYGLTWTQSMPSGTNGLMVIVYNSNAGVLSSRLYIYTNDAWHYIAIV